MGPHMLLWITTCLVGAPTAPVGIPEVLLGSIHFSSPTGPCGDQIGPVGPQVAIPEVLLGSICFSGVLPVPVELQLSWWSPTSLSGAPCVWLEPPQSLWLSQSSC